MPGLPVLACDSCDALLLIDRGEIAQVGDSGRMPFDVSPLQLGTTLQVENQRGAIMGRERWAWERGSWNEWLLHLSDASHRWVAEEAGLYMMMAPIEPQADVAARLAELAAQGRSALGETVDLGDARYVVADIKTIRCVAGEGHLPVAVPADFPRQSLDLRSADGRVLTWQSDSASSGCWAGRYRRLAELAPANLRRLEGWARPDFEAAA